MTVLTTDQIVDAPDGNQFRVISPLGEGLTSRVYKAVQLPGEKIFVALKVLKPDLAETFVQSFRDEADILSSLRLEESRIGDGLRLIPGVVSRATDSNLPVRFLAMEYVDGESVLDMLNREPLPEAIVLTIADQVLRVLDLLHTKLRRSYTDFQLKNIWWQPDEGQIKLMDWNHVSRPAPEDQSPAGVAEDLVRLGAFLYQLATGKGAMQTGETVGTLAARAGDIWQKKLSVGTQTLIERALHPNKARRFATAAEFREAVQELQELWRQDEDDLHDDAVDAMRAVRDEKGQRDPVLLRKAETLVDVLHRRQPTELTGKWRTELEKLTDQVSPAWGSGRQYYRAALYSEALKLWPDEAAAWGRPDLWRWVILARQGADDIAAYEQHRPDYERAIELLGDQHWKEAENRLMKLPGGPSDDLRRETRAHQRLSEAEIAERDRRWEEAEYAYQSVADELAGIVEEGFGNSLRDVYGWIDLERRSETARLRRQQMIADQTVVEELRGHDLSFDEFSSRAFAGLRDNPSNLGLLDLIAERAGQEELSPHERRELALLGLQYGNPPPNVMGLLRDAQAKADTELDEIEALRIAEEQKAARRYQDEIERKQLEEESARMRALEQARMDELARQELAAKEEEQRLVAVARQENLNKLRNDFTTNDYVAMLSSAAVAGADMPEDIRNVLTRRFKAFIDQKKINDAVRLMTILASADESGHAARAKGVRRLIEADFKAALKSQKFGDAEQLVDQLQAVDTDSANHLAQELARARSRNVEEEEKNREAIMAKVVAIGTLLGVSRSARELESPDRMKAEKAYKQAESELRELDKLLEKNGQADLLPPGTLKKLHGDVEAESRGVKSLDGGPTPDSADNDSQEGSPGMLDKITAFLKGSLPVLALAVLMLGAGVALGFVFDRGGEEGENGSQAVMGTQTTEAALVAVNPTSTPTPTNTPESPTPIITPSIEPTSSPTTPPTDTPTATPMPPVDLLPDGRTTPAPVEGVDPNAPANYFDMPDLALTAPEGWLFNWAGTDLQLIDTTNGTAWTLYIAAFGPDGGDAVPLPVPASVAGIDTPPDATPTPDGVPAPTEGSIIRLEWARWLDSAPLSPGEHTVTLSLVSPNGEMREVAPIPPVVIVPAPTVVVAQTANNLQGTPEPGRVRKFPLWNTACDITTGEGVAGATLEAIGQLTAPRPGDPDALFLLVRRANSRVTFWLPDTDVANTTDLTALLNQLPPVVAPVGKCDPNS